LRLWHVIVSPTRRPGFEVRPLVHDAILRDWREEGVRLLAVSWLGAEALVPRGLVKLSIGESGAWFGPPEYAAAQPRERMVSAPVLTVGGAA